MIRNEPSSSLKEINWFKLAKGIILFTNCWSFRLVKKMTLTLLVLVLMLSAPTLIAGQKGFYLHQKICEIGCQCVAHDFEMNDNTPSFKLQVCPVCWRISCRLMQSWWKSDGKLARQGYIKTAAVGFM